MWDAAYRDILNEAAKLLMVRDYLKWYIVVNYYMERFDPLSPDQSSSTRALLSWLVNWNDSNHEMVLFQSEQQNTLMKLCLHSSIFWRISQPFHTHQSLFVMLLMLPPLSHNTIPVANIDQLIVDLILIDGWSHWLDHEPVAYHHSCCLISLENQSSECWCLVGATVQLWLPAATISWLLPWTLNLVAAYTPNLVANLLPSRDLVAFRLPAFTSQDLFSGVLSFVACPADRFCLCPK